MVGSVAELRPATQQHTDEHAAFIALARELRAMGAMRVRDGALEVAFGEAYQPPEPPAEDDRRPRATERTLSRDEREELEDLRRLKRYQEELP